MLLKRLVDELTATIIEQMGVPEKYIAQGPLPSITAMRYAVADVLTTEEVHHAIKLGHVARVAASHEALRAQVARAVECFRSILAAENPRDMYDKAKDALAELGEPEDAGYAAPVARRAVRGEKNE